MLPKISATLLPFYATPHRRFHGHIATRQIRKMLNYLERHALPKIKTLEAKIRLKTTGRKNSN